MIEYVKLSTNRHKKFQIITTIETKQGKKFARKTAHTTQAKDYVVHLMHGYERLLPKTSEDTFQLANSWYDDESFMTEYVAAPTVVAEFTNNVTSKNLNDAHALLDDIITRIKRLPRPQQFTDDQRKKLADLFGDGFLSETELVDFGYVDFNLDNIIIFDGKYFLIDYEWIFDIPVPEKLVIGRLLYYAFSRIPYTNYTKSELYHDTKTGLTLPRESYENYKNYLGDVAKVVEAEQHFQSYVGSHEQDEETQSSARELEEKLAVYEDRVQQLEKELLETGDKYNEAVAEIGTLRAQITELENTFSKKVSRKLKNLR